MRSAAPTTYSVAPATVAFRRGSWCARAIGASVVLFAIFAISALGCAGSKGSAPNAQSPERQSEAEYDIARDLFQKGDVRVALDHVRKAITLNEENDKAHYLKAAVLLSFCSGPQLFAAPDCRLADVETSTRTALKHNPDFRDARNLLGQVLINEKKYSDAIGVLEPLSKDPAYVYPHLVWGNLGWAQVMNGQLDAGIASLRNAVTEPRFCVGHYRLGIGFEKKGDSALAEQWFTTAVSVDDPQCTALQDAWEARGRVRSKLGKVSDARTDYERCVEISKETETGKTCARELGKLGTVGKMSPQSGSSSASASGGAASK